MTATTRCSTRRTPGRRSRTRPGRAPRAPRSARSGRASPGGWRRPGTRAGPRRRAAGRRPGGDRPSGSRRGRGGRADGRWSRRLVRPSWARSRASTRARRSASPPQAASRYAARAAGSVGSRAASRKMSSHSLRSRHHHAGTRAVTQCEELRAVPSPESGRNVYPVSPASSADRGAGARPGRRPSGGRPCAVEMPRAAAASSTSGRRSSGVRPAGGQRVLGGEPGRGPRPGRAGRSSTSGRRPATSARSTRPAVRRRASRRPLRRAASTRMRRMASAAAAKKWPRPSQRLVGRADQPEVRLVDEGGRLEGLAGRLGGQPAGGELPQLVVHEREHSAAGGRSPAAAARRGRSSGPCLALPYGAAWGEHAFWVRTG